MCLLDAAGVGVTAVLGVGGRDLSAAVGGRSTLAAMALLDEHPGDRVSWSSCRSRRTRRWPTQIARPPRRWRRRRSSASSDAAATTSPRDGEGARRCWAITAEPPREWPAPAARPPTAGFVRGLFSGGTLCDEAMAIAAETLGPIASNTPLEPEWALAARPARRQHLMIDFGDDQLTQGRPHPMIDQTLRLERHRRGGRRPRVRRAAARRRPRLRIARRPGLRARTRHRAGPRPRRGRTAATSPWSSAWSARRATRRASTAPRTRWPPPGASVHLSNAAAARAAVALVEGV